MWQAEQLPISWLRRMPQRRPLLLGAAEWASQCLRMLTLQNGLTLHELAHHHEASGRRPTAAQPRFLLWHEGGWLGGCAGRQPTAAHLAPLLWTTHLSCPAIHVLSEAAA